jgi:hypothetical protein
MANGAWTWYGLDGPDGAHHVIVIATWPQPDRRLEMVACLDTGGTTSPTGDFR